MNKTLIAMAVAGVMAAPMAAQADATVYGKMHVSIDVGDTGLNNDSGPNNTDGIFWQSNSSRLGFKGSEDLGGGLSAIWQIESNVRVGNNNNGAGKSVSFGGRNTYVGLKGGWGEVRGGQHDTPFKGTGRKFDLFGDQIGDSRNVIQYVGGAGAEALGFDEGWDERPGNVVAYMTPNFGGGFKVFAAYVIDDATEDATGLSIEGSWKSGNWLAAVAYETHDQDSTAGPGFTSSSDGIRAGLQWSPGAWKLNAFYQTITDANGIEGFDGDAYGVGAAYKMGKNVLKAQMFASSNDIVGVTDNVDATMFAVGWDYNMSKRTTAYIAYATTSNDSDAYYCADAGGHGGEVCGQAEQIAGANPETGDPSVISFGMIHKF